MGDNNILTINPPIKPISFLLAQRAMTSESPNQSVSIVFIEVYLAEGLTRKHGWGFGFNNN